MPTVEALPPSDAEVKLAKRLFRSMAGGFNYGDVRDVRQERMLEMIEAKINGTEPLSPMPLAPVSRSLSMAESLQQSIRLETTKRIPSASPIKAVTRVSRKKLSA